MQEFFAPRRLCSNMTGIRSKQRQSPPQPRCRCVIECNSRNGCEFPSGFISDDCCLSGSISVPGGARLEPNSIPPQNNNQEETISFLQFAPLLQESRIAYTLFTIMWRTESPSS